MPTPRLKRERAAADRAGVESTPNAATSTSADGGLAESYRATAIAAGALSAGPFLEETLRHLARLSVATRCAILLVEDGRLRPGAALGLSNEYLAALDGVIVSPEIGACGAAAATGRPCVTADIDADAKWAGFRASAQTEGVRSCWSVPIVLPGGQVLGTFASYGEQPGTPAPAAMAAVQEYAPIVALGLESIRRESELARSYEATVLALSAALDSRDEYTAAHSTETATLAERIGARLGLDARERETLARVAVLHDIGKLGIPSEILSKPGPLTPEEWVVMRRHPVIGERILTTVPFLQEVARAVRHEHERWDGGGYPDGIAGERIPMASRIVLVSDGYHAMTSDRPYRAAMTPALAQDELRAHAGTQFDPAVVEALLAELGAPDGEPLLPAQRVQAQAREHALAAIAGQLGAVDLFVFRPTACGGWCHFDGVGRGAGWAGNVELRLEQEPHVREALATGRPAWLEDDAPVRVVGPYFARGAAIVVTARGELVVFGEPSHPLGRADDDVLAELAARAANAVVEIPPAKRLADELEVLEAVRAVTAVAADSLPAALEAIAERATAALSCEFAAVATRSRDGAPAVIGWVGPGWSPARGALVHEALTQLLDRAHQLPLLVQDTTGRRRRSNCPASARPTGSPRSRRCRSAPTTPSASCCSRTRAPRRGASPCCAGASPARWPRRPRRWCAAPSRRSA